MIRKFRIIFLVVVITAMSFFLPGCSPQNSQSKGEVVIYTSVDQVYSEPIFKAFEENTGIHVKPVYDIEANKTVGLANRLEAEKSAPQADVFWNGEVLQTLALADKDVFEPIVPTEASGLPSGFKDPQGFWFAFGGRGRVLIYNQTLVQSKDCPQTMEALKTSSMVTETGIAYPVFGTTNTQAAALYAAWGEEKARAYYQSLKAAGIQVVDGNSVVKDFVSQKKLAAGLTDTDDALSEMKTNPDLGIIFLDQGENDIGTMVIPNTVARVKGGPNSDNAVVFIDYLLSTSTEQQLVDSGWIQIPVHDGVTPAAELNLEQIKIMAVDFNQAYKMLATATADMTEIFVR